MFPEWKSSRDFCVFSVIAYDLKVLASFFGLRGHVLEKWLFFRFAEGVRTCKLPFAGSRQFTKAADSKNNHF